MSANRSLYHNFAKLTTRQYPESQLPRPPGNCEDILVYGCINSLVDLNTVADFNRGENRDSLIALGELKGSMEGLRAAVEGQARDTRLWQSQHSEDDTRHFRRIESILERTSEESRRSSEGVTKSLQTQIDEGTTSIEKTEAAIARLEKAVDIEAGRSEVRARNNQVFRWIITCIIALLGIWMARK